ncbi:hypothetical protein ACTIVE_3089 [Actinomadura verrucosospora]|uniref:Uncharacterized protein n=1 Tax=Actinomadura verrucosospora TaxID=46165 RepID=A0A7D3VXL2_ACTVE|nr:hypothetical protein ACTIVE_3089 [Actinomadura verrucosospora]
MDEVHREATPKALLTLEGRPRTPAPPHHPNTISPHELDAEHPTLRNPRPEHDPQIFRTYPPIHLPSRRMSRGMSATCCSRIICPATMPAPTMPPSRHKHHTGSSRTHFFTWCAGAAGGGTCPSPCRPGNPCTGTSQQREQAASLRRCRPNISRRWVAERTLA